MIGKGVAEHPKLPEPFPSGRRYWKCPKTGLLIPKWEGENREWREKTLKQAQNDPVLQKDILAACKKSVLYWINLCCWTKWEWEFDPDQNRFVMAQEAHHPFITFERQDELFGWFDDRFENSKDGLVNKSRRMGASWCCVYFNHHKWLFRPGTEIREMSRSEVYVDSPIAKSLFYKHDYINAWLPSWMCPPGVLQRGKRNRTAMRLYNELNGSTIAGESTTKHALSADRCAILLLDEFAKVENGDEIRTATADVAPCRIVNSTAAGAGTSYSQWKQSGLIDTFSLMFWDHPTMGKGRFVLQDQTTKRYYISSIYAQHEEKRRSTKELAQELYAEDLEAGDTFFDLQNLDTHIAMFARPPMKRFEIDFKKGVADDMLPRLIRDKDTKCFTFREAKEGRLEVWVDLINGRPDQSKTYIFGIDTSKGQGASESVISIKCDQTGEIIAKWKCRNTPEHGFARIVTALCLWCGGSNPRRLPFLKWENNGPGWTLGRLLVKEFLYPYYYCSGSVGTVTDKTSDKYGFQTNRTSKELLLREYERALLQGKVINHDERGLEQAKYYIYYPNGGVGPATLQDKKQADMLLHGDIVMADALTADNKNVAKLKEKKVTAPFGSWGSRFESWQRSLKQSGWRRRYDFR